MYIRNAKRKDAAFTAAKDMRFFRCDWPLNERNVTTRVPYQDMDVVSNCGAEVSGNV